MEIPINECNCCGSKSFSQFMQPKCYLTEEKLSAVKCNDCDFIFLSPRPDPKKGQDYFNKAYAGHEDFNDHEYYRDHDKKLFQSKLKIEAIEKLNPKGKKLLDVGAGQGHFMKEARDRGWDVVGTELSIEARESAKKLFDLSLLESFDGFAESTFDVITLWDVLEHVSDAKEILEEVSKLLKKDGILIIETVNIDSVDFLVQKEKWHLWHVDHNYYFSMKSLRSFLEQFNYHQIQFLTGAETTKQDKRTVKQFVTKYLKDPQKVFQELNRRKLMKKSPGQMQGYTVIISARKQ